MLIVNLWGAPGSGKSTTAAGLFFLLKINKWRVELVTEFAKEMVWERNELVFGDQVFIFAEQNRRLRRLETHDVDVAITDSPIPLPVFYQPDGYLSSFEAVAFEQFNRYHNVNYYLRRACSFEAIGRRHSENEANRIDGALLDFMKRHGVPAKEVEANPQTPQVIFDDLMRQRAPAIPMPLGPVAGSR